MRRDIGTDDPRVKVRPGRASRPRTKIRPDYTGEPLARVIAVDRGRYRLLLEDGVEITAVKARELGLPELNPETDRVMICGSPHMLRDLKALCEARGFKEGNTTTPGDFVIERAFVEK